LGSAFLGNQSLHYPIISHSTNPRRQTTSQSIFRIITTSEDALVSLFTPQYSGIRVKQNADTNAKPLSHARIPYTIDRMKQTISTLILNYPENYIFDIDASIQEQVTARTNAALFEADLAHTKLSTHVIDKNIMETLSKHAQLKEYKHVTITKQPSIDFNIIMEKMQQHIEDNAHDPTLQKLIYSGLESLVLIFA